MSRDLRVLIFQPVVPPYRFDWYNAVSEHCDLRLALFRQTLLEQQYDQAALRKKLRVEQVELTHGITIMERTIRLGILKAIRRFSPNVVVTPEFSPVSMTVAIQPRRYLNYSHIVMTDDNPFIVRQEQPIRTLARRFILAKIQGLITTSGETTNLYVNRYGYSGANGIVPYLPDEIRFQESIQLAWPTAVSLIEKHGLEGKRVILSVGRLAHVKRIDRLIRAFSDIYCSSRDSILAIVGDGSERPKLEYLAKQLGVGEKVIFAGRTVGRALYAWYGLGRLLVLPSAYEPFGATVAEALAAGMPVICSNIAGARTLVENGVTGTVLDPAKPQLLQNAILHWIRSVEPICHSKGFSLRPPHLVTNFRESVDSFLELLRAVVPEK